MSSPSDDYSTKTAVPERRRAEDALPPVEPPTAGFLLQLFFIPLLIVGIIVLVWLSIGYLANMGQDVDKTLATLKTDGGNDWIKLNTMSSLLRDPQQSALRHNAIYAERAAEGLTMRLDAAEQGLLQDADSVKFRAAYSRFLGESFAVPEVIPAIFRAATQVSSKRPADSEEIRVRISALEGLAALASQIGPDELLARPELQEVLDKALAEQGDALQGQLRERAAFLLGVLGGPKELDRLVQLMTEDPLPNVRYNATLGLCRAGDARATSELVRMLDPASTEVVEGEKTPKDAAWKRQTVQANAIEGIKQLLAKNPAIDAKPLADALTKLRAAGVPRAIDVEAAELLLVIEGRAKPETP